MNTVRSEDSPVYGPTKASAELTREQENHVIVHALEILRGRLNRQPIYSDPTTVRNMLTLQYGECEREVFTVTFLDTQHRLIAHEAMFSGTTNQTHVYPREVVKRALKLNATAVILSHNHPSGETMPSEADKRLTKTLERALQLVDVRVLDHVIVGRSGSTSFAECGLL